jgi:hypothetical protein
MVYDPAWDMPKVNWVQQGSYEPGEIPPIYAPDAEPLVCLPPINQYWLPFVLGCLDQLRQPTTWITADNDAKFAALSAANRLMQMFGERAACMSYSIRFDGETCQLQQSVDGGTTWTEVEGWSSFAACLPPQTQVSFDDGCTLYESFDGGTTLEPVPGWIDNFGNCVQKYTPIVGLPPNPGDQTHAQLACSIATYLAETVILDAMGKAVTAIQDDLTLLQFGLSVLNIIPEFVLVGLAADAFSGIYVAVQEGTLSDFEAALTDSTLLSDVKCAILGCIQVDGYVKPDNFSCILSAIEAISYAHSDVIHAIATYLTALGAVGLAQLSQVAGLESGADCSACGWCHYFDFTVSDGGWTAVPSEDGLPAAVYVPTVGWQHYLPPSGGSQCRIQRTFDAETPDVSVVSVDYFLSAASSGSVVIALYIAGTETFLSVEAISGSGGENEYQTPGFGADAMQVDVDLNDASVVQTITHVTLHGTGTDPFADYPC